MVRRGAEGPNALYRLWPRRPSGSDLLCLDVAANRKPDLAGNRSLVFFSQRNYSGVEVTLDTDVGDRILPVPS